MDLIVAVDMKWGIGRDGELLRRISGDMKRFRQMTMDNVLVLGRKTLESFPGGKPLPKREHIVLTGNQAYQAEGVQLCHGIGDLTEALQQIEDKKVFVVGGGSVYQQLLPFCERAYVTKIQDSFPADTYFPNLDENSSWTLVEKGEIQEEDGVKFSFDLYEQKRK